MITRVIKAFPWWNALFLFAGIVIALVLIPVVSAGIGIAVDMYDRANPVATAKLHSAEKIDHNTLRVTLLVTRHRDCEIARVTAFTGNNPALMTNASVVRREDGSAPISYPVGITALSQPWLLSPVYGPRVWVWAYYECDGRIVKTKLIDEVVQ